MQMGLHSTLNLQILLDTSICNDLINIYANEPYYRAREFPPTVHSTYARIY